MRFRSVHAVAFILLSAYCLIGCDFAVFDDLVSCPQGVSFHFYRQTPCEQFPNYPSDIRQVRVFAFDANGVLVGEFSDAESTPFSGLFLVCHITAYWKTYICRMGWQ